MTEPGPRFAVVFPFLLVHVGVACGLNFLYYWSLNDETKRFFGFVGVCFSSSLLITGLITLSVQLRNQILRSDAQHAYDAIHAMLPVTITNFAWPVIWVMFFPIPFPILLVILGCLIWSASIFTKATEGYCHFLRIGPARWLRWILLFVMVTLILGSLFIFGALLNHLETQGYKVGWS